MHDHVFSLKSTLITTKAVRVGLLDDAAYVESLTVLSRFRTDFYACLATRADALFELTDSLLCADGPVKTLVDPLPRAADGRIMLACDVSDWLRPDTATSAERLFCHTYGRGRGSAQMIPGWPYSIVAALEPGRTSWTALLDAVRLGPGADETAVTATQLREVVERLCAAGHWTDGDLPILIVLDAGYDVVRLAFLLAGLPVELLGRLRSDRVLYFPPPPQPPGKVGAGSPSVGQSSNSPTRAPGPHRPAPPPVRPAVTGRPSPGPGTGCTRC